MEQGLAQLVARTPGGREVASSSLVALTKIIIEVAELFCSFLSTLYLPATRHRTR